MGKESKGMNVESIKPCHIEDLFTEIADEYIGNYNANYIAAIHDREKLDKLKAGHAHDMLTLDVFRKWVLLKIELESELITALKESQTVLGELMLAVDETLDPEFLCEGISDLMDRCGESIAQTAAAIQKAEGE